MSYVATKPVKFRKQYYLGDIIPADEILPQSEQRLIDMGLIARVSEAETPTIVSDETHSQEENEQGDGDISAEGNEHVLDEKSENTEPGNEDSTLLADAKTIEDFMKFKKEQLIEYSKAIDLPVDNGMKKEEIAKALALATN